MTNTITATITASQFNAMTKAALFAFAAEKGIKVLKKMDKATLVQTIMAATGQQPAEAPAEAPTEQVADEIVVLGTILGGVDYDVLGSIVEVVEDEPVEEVCSYYTRACSTCRGWDLREMGERSFLLQGEPLWLPRRRLLC